MLLQASQIVGQDTRKPNSKGPITLNWPTIGGDRECQRYSSDSQINRDNVGQLEVAWTFSTGEAAAGRARIMECTPIMVDGLLYFTSGQRVVYALRADTGQPVWKFDRETLDLPRFPLASGGVNRGVAYWTDGRPGGKRRIFLGSAEGYLFSLDAATGELDSEFGQSGTKDLREDLELDLSQMPYGPTSAPGIVGDTIVVGFSCGEGPGPAAPGDIRAFDIHSGDPVWTFRTVPKPGELGTETWEGDSWRGRGAANAWGGFSIDTKRGWVFAGLGSAAFDFYGGDRPGKNLFANCVVALDGKTGELQWHFQTLHHDLWDHDLPTYPNLVTISRDGGAIEAVAQVTKTGYVFVLDRETGTPLFPIDEVAAEQSTVPGETAWPTQPVPRRPPAFSQQVFNEDNVTEIAEANRKYVLEQMSGLRYGGRYQPPSLEGTVVVPGFHGGATWSGASFDPESNLLYVNSNNQPNVLTLVENKTGSGYPYRITGYNKLLDQEGYPGIKPPWGQLTAIDLGRGEIVWQSVLGEYPELTARGIPPTGTENFGGSIVTAGGLVFIAGTKDEMFRAFDKRSGKVLWESKLPAGGYATPSTYRLGDRQFVVIPASGGGKLGTPTSDQVIAYSLPVR